MRIALCSRYLFLKVNAVSLNLNELEELEIVLQYGGICAVNEHTCGHTAYNVVTVPCEKS